mmetsp:Transcript_2936/g.8056  ORF Transcript_2936/g.8056 Transcript_2936/m.8056 type:complete len:111 (-) Transcript_2936:373-705(-)
MRNPVVASLVERHESKLPVDVPIVSRFLQPDDLHKESVRIRILVSKLLVLHGQLPRNARDGRGSFSTHRSPATRRHILDDTVSGDAVAGFRGRFLFCSTPEASLLLPRML